MFSRRRDIVVALLSLLACGATQRSAIGDERPSTQPGCCESAWSGFYLGVHSGYGWGDNDFIRDPFGGTGGTLDGVQSDGALVGGHAGFNWQYGWLVGGGEFDLSFANIEGTSNEAVFDDGQGFERDRVRQEQQLLGSLRGRVGATIQDVLLYVTGGVAWQRLKETTTQEVSVPFTFTRHSAEDRWGWVAGLGAEAQLGGGWLGRLEFLHYDFGAIGTARSESFPDFQFQEKSGELTTDVLRTALSYQFGGAPVRRASDSCCGSAPWAGFYAGVHGGYGRSRNDFSLPFFPNNFLVGPDPDGRIVGGLAGHNWQAGPLVGGFEADLGFADMQEFSSPVIVDLGEEIVGIGRGDNIKYLGSLRARLGFTPEPWVLLYGTAGLGWERIERTDVVIEAAGGPVFTVFRTDPLDHFGWVAGAGGEALLGNSGLVARIEYLHYDFGQIEGSFSQSDPNGLVSASDGGRHTVDTVRGALAFKLGGTPNYSDSHGASRYDWSGPYLGAHAAYGWGDNDFSQLKSNNPLVASSGISSEGGLLGGIAGYNAQFGAIVAGGEVDFSETNVEGSEVIPLPSLETTRQEIDYIATARARIGYTITPDALLYGTAGLAWERVDQMRITSLIDGTTTNAAAFDRFGWVAGGGLDAALGDGGWIGRIEYLHHNFGTVETTRHTTTDPPIATPPFTNTADDQTVDEVRAALVYKIH